MRYTGGHARGQGLEQGGVGQPPGFESSLSSFESSFSRFGSGRRARTLGGRAGREVGVPRRMRGASQGRDRSSGSLQRERRGGTRGGRGEAGRRRGRGRRGGPQVRGTAIPGYRAGHMAVSAPVGPPQQEVSREAVNRRMENGLPTLQWFRPRVEVVGSHPLLTRRRMNGAMDPGVPSTSML